MMRRVLNLPVILAGMLVVGSGALADWQGSGATPSPALSPEVAAGRELFVQQCGYCHGRDAAGGEAGPDLTRSKLVAQDTRGDKIGPVVHNGRVDHGMPPFAFSEPQLSSIVAFIHYQKTVAEAQNGYRRGVEPADLQTGNAEAGKKYFYGAGKCSSCHSPTGDLAHVAQRYVGLDLERRLLYPADVRSTITVKPPSGQAVSGELAYRDEFTVALRDASGRYHSWRAASVTYTIDAPAEAHVRLLAEYTDADIHNLMAYLQTLR